MEGLKTEGRYKVEVLVAGETAYVSNALRFDDPDDALRYASDLFSRWTALRDYRVVDTKATTCK